MHMIQRIILYARTQRIVTAFLKQNMLAVIERKQENGTVLS